MRNMWENIRCRSKASELHEDRWPIRRCAFSNQKIIRRKANYAQIWSSRFINIHKTTRISFWRPPLSPRFSSLHEHPLAPSISRSVVRFGSSALLEIFNLSDFFGFSDLILSLCPFANCISHSIRCFKRKKRKKKTRLDKKQSRRKSSNLAIWHWSSENRYHTSCSASCFNRYRRQTFKENEEKWTAAQH